MKINLTSPAFSTSNHLILGLHSSMLLKIGMKKEANASFRVVKDKVAFGDIAIPLEVANTKEVLKCA